MRAADRSLTLASVVAVLAACASAPPDGPWGEPPPAYLADTAAPPSSMTAGEVMGPVLRAGVDAAQYGLPVEAGDLRAAAAAVMTTLAEAKLSPASRVQLAALEASFRDAVQDSAGSWRARATLLRALTDAGADLADTSRALRYFDGFGPPAAGASREPRLPDDDLLVLNEPLTGRDFHVLRDAVLAAASRAPVHGPQFRQGLGMMMAALTHHGAPDVRWRSLEEYARMEQEAGGGMAMGRALLPPHQLRWLAVAGRVKEDTLPAVIIPSLASLLPPP